MTPQYILKKSLCRPPHCDGGYRHFAESEIENLGYAPEYATGQGYDQPAKGILFTNWNYFPQAVTSILERYGYQCEWSDEWMTCDGCQKALRTSPNSYGWLPAYYMFEDGTAHCLECIDTEEYLTELEDNPRKAVALDHIKPAEHGYTMLAEDFQSGFHPGQTDDPVKIQKDLEAKGYSKVLFKITDKGQFDITFEVYAKERYGYPLSDPAFEDTPYFDRFDICEAYYLYAVLCHGGQFSPEYAIHGRLHKIDFKARPMLSEPADLEDNGKAVYGRLARGERKVRTIC